MQPATLPIVPETISATGCNPVRDNPAMTSSALKGITVPAKKAASVIPTNPYCIRNETKMSINSISSVL